MASEYGWTDEYILERVYPDRLFFASKNIQRRQTEGYIMQMQISAYPHMEEQVQRQFASKLHEAYGQAYGIQTNALDRAKLHSLKKRLSGERRSGVRVG